MSELDIVQTQMSATMRRMRGAVLYNINAPLVIETLTIPALKEGQVLVRVMASGLCHKQLEEMNGKRGEDPYLPHLLGHEGAGIVEETGPGVTHVKPGDHVVLGWMKGRGMNSATPTYTADNRKINAGCITTFNERAVVSENRVTPIDKRMPFDAACLLGCAVTTGLGVVRRIAKMEPKKSVAVFGVGGIGLNVVQWSALTGASKIIALDLREDKLELAKKIGATHTVNVSHENGVETIRELTQGEGADYVFEAVGNARVMEQAYEAANKSGLAVFIGVPKKEDKFCIDPIPLYLGKRITGCHGGDTVKEEDIPYCVDMYLSGKLKLDELITDRIRLDEINTVFDKMKEGKIVGRAIIKF